MELLGLIEGLSMDSLEIQVRMRVLQLRGEILVLLGQFLAEAETIFLSTQIL